MRVALVAASLLLASCATVATGATVVAAVAAPIVSRAQGNCYAQCVAGTECDHQTGMCVARRAETGSQGVLPPPLPEAAPAADAGLEPAPTAALGFRDEGYGFDCTTRSGWGDEVFADDDATAERVCAELNGEPCACTRSARPAE